MGDPTETIIQRFNLRWGGNGLRGQVLNSCWPLGHVTVAVGDGIPLSTTPTVRCPLGSGEERVGRSKFRCRPSASYAA